MSVLNTKAAHLRRRILTRYDARIRVDSHSRTRPQSRTESQQRVEAQTQLNSVPTSYTHKRIKTGRAYQLHLSIWGQGTSTTLDANTDGDVRLQDVEDFTRQPPKENSLKPRPEEKFRTTAELSQELKAKEHRLSGDDHALVEELRRRDQHVRSHEQAHASAGGGVVVCGPQYSYQRGPDGQLYAIGGSVQIDASSVPNDPEATIRKMQKVRQAALAPSDPSPEDMQVAAHAAAAESQARAQLAQMLIQEQQKIRQRMGVSTRKMDSSQATVPSNTDQSIAAAVDTSTQPTSPKATVNARTAYISNSWIHIDVCACRELNPAKGLPTPPLVNKS